MKKQLETQGDETITLLLRYALIERGYQLPDTEHEIPPLDPDIPAFLSENLLPHVQIPKSKSKMVDPNMDLDKSSQLLHDLELDKYEF
jgi:hypothetical protein